MNLFKRKKILVTHNGTFHADDIFACATLSILNNGNIKVIRTRDPKIFENGDYVFDVGGVYNPEKNRFDHHQKGGAGVRENGVPYASFGLVWKHFGIKLCDEDKEVWQLIDKKIVAHIDCIDNGVDFLEIKFKDVFCFSGDQNFLIYLPTWDEKNKDIDKVFIEQVKKASLFLKREIEVARSDTKGKNIILDNYKNAEDKRVVIVEKDFSRYLYQKILSELIDPVYIILPSDTAVAWKVEAIIKNPSTLESRKPFPESWRGMFNGDQKLKDLTGVSDTVFCHRSGFLITVKSKQGAIALAKKALEN